MTALAWFIVGVSVGVMGAVVGMGVLGRREGVGGLEAKPRLECFSSYTFGGITGAEAEGLVTLSETATVRSVGNDETLEPTADMIRLSHLL